MSDTGIGIDPVVQDLIFARFYQSGQVAIHSSGDTKFKGAGPDLALPFPVGSWKRTGTDLGGKPRHDEGAFLKRFPRRAATQAGQSSGSRR